MRPNFSTYRHAVQRQSDAFLDVFELAHVHTDWQSLHTQALKLLSHGIDCAWQIWFRSRRLGGNDYVAALLRQRYGTCLANATSGAADNGNLASQIGRFQLRAQGARA